MNLKLAALSGALLAASLSSLADTNPCLQSEGGKRWEQQSIGAQPSTFSTTFSVRLNGHGSGQVGLASGTTTSANQLPVMLRFNTKGKIEARNGDVFAADKAIIWHPNLSYRIRVDVDLAKQRYSVWVQQPGRNGKRVTLLAKDYALHSVSGLGAIDSVVIHSAATDKIDANDGQGALMSVCNAMANASVAPMLEAVVSSAAVAADPLPPNADCTLIVPDNPLSAAGLATPYQLVATDPTKGACHELNDAQSAFVQAAILDPATGQVSAYSPLVIDQGTQPAVPPVVPNLPANAVVALWFGYNGDNLTLKSQNHGITDGKCVNGLGSSVFGQFAQCNAPAFFTAAERAIAIGRLKIPPLLTGKDGQMCPSTRSFMAVDQDQSDNVPTEYFSVNGLVAQHTAAVAAKFPGAQKFGNPSDERLVSFLLNPALGCDTVTAPDLADPGQQVPLLALNELQANHYQTAPIALVPLNDPMTQVDGANSLAKLNLYRAGVDMRAAASAADANPTSYCSDLRKIAPSRLQLDRAIFTGRPSPFPDVANSLYTFLAQRYITSYETLGCQDLLKLPVNMSLTTDATGVVTDANLVNDTFSAASKYHTGDVVGFNGKNYSMTVIYGGTVVNNYFINGSSCAPTTCTSDKRFVWGGNLVSYWSPSN